MPDERTYIKLHDGMPDHPKVELLSDAAFRLLVTTWCWCSRHLTDGRIKEAVWLKRGNAKTRAELMAAGLAETLDSGVIQMHDYLSHQRSAAEVREIQLVKRNAGKHGANVGNHRRWHVARGLIDPDCDLCPDVSAEPSAPADTEPIAQRIGVGSAKHRSETETETEGIEETSIPKPRKRGHRLPEEWQPTVDDVAWARTERLDDLTARRETDKFRDHWHAASGQNATKLNWSLAWRNWMRTVLERQPRNGVKPSPDTSWMQSMPGDAS